MKKFILNSAHILAVFFVAIAVLHQTAYAGDDSKKIFKGEKVAVSVDGLSCPFCAYGLEKKLKSLDGVGKIDIKVNDGMVFLYLKEGPEITEAVLRKKVEEAGFTPRDITAMKPTEEIDSSSHKVTLKIEGMRCENCVSRIENALKEVGCANDIGVSLQKNQVSLICLGDQEPLVEAVEKAGFKAEIVKAKEN
jgi:mercuric ion binding protein